MLSDQQSLVVRAKQYARGVVHRLARRPGAVGRRLKGLERTCSAPLCIEYQGDSRHAPYLEALAFRRRPESEPVSGVQREADLLVTEGRHKRAGDDRFFIPFWIGTEVDITAMVQQSRNSKAARENQYRFRRRAFSLTVQRQPEQLARYFRTMHHPYVTGPHGDPGLLLSEAEMTAAAANRELLLLCAGDVPVCGHLLDYRRDQATISAPGIRDGDPRHARNGALRALYHFTFRHLEQRGVRRAHLGLSRPFFDDAALQLKHHPSTRVTDSTGHGLWLEPRRYNVGLKRFLVRNPFIAREGKGLKGVVFVDDFEPVVPQKRMTRLRLAGLNAIELYRLPRVAEGALTCVGRIAL